MADVTPGSTGAMVPVVPGATGALPTDQAHAEAGAVVHPRDEAPPAEDTARSGAPATAPDDAADESKRVAEWKKSLPPDQQKMVDRIVTEVGQKNAERLAALEATSQRLAWADELNRLVASENAADRQKAAALLKATLSTLEQLAPTTEPDPLARAEEAIAELEAFSPAAAALMRAQAQELQGLRQQLGQVAGTAQSVAQARADEALERDLTTLSGWAKEQGLPYAEAEVLKTADALGITDVKRAYFATYGEQLIEHGKQAAFKSLQVKQRASLPGGATTPGTGSHPPVKDMMEAFQRAKADLGVTGEVSVR